MKKSTMKMILSLLLAAILLITTNTVQAATANITSNGSNAITVEEGKTITVNLSINAAAWNVEVNGGGLTTSDVTSFVGYSEDTTNTNISKTITYNATKVGTYTISLSGDITDESKTKADTVSGKITVTVKAKEQTPVQPENPTTPETPTTTTPETPSTPETPTTTTPETPTTPEKPTTSETPTTPTVTEPKFTNANKTMYATGNINLRSSWSTSSSATKITKGTELTITGTSTEKVNDYVWYRVSYNGQTKYVASNLLTNTKPEEEKKSNNANLKSLTIENQELVPEFSSTTTSYTMQVAKDITNLEIKAQPEDDKAKVTVQGNEQLKEGENIVTVSVSAEDETVKLYEIKVTKIAETKVLGLQSLKIEDTNMETMFKPEKYNYEIDVKEVTKLEIEAIANEENATVEILGNEDLQEGENLITIIVSSQDGTEKVTYQIKANKVANVAPTIAKQIDVKIYVYAAIGTILLIALIIVIVYTIKNRNQEEYEYTDNIEELPEREEQELEKTQKMNNTNMQEESIEEQKNEERRAKIDYFLDDKKEEKPKRKKGKHF